MTPEREVAHRIMATRGRPIGRRHQEDVRLKIQAIQLVKRLSGHAFGEIEMSSSQIKAAEILLKKSVPDLQSVDLNGTLEHKHTLADVLGSISSTGDGSKVA